MNGNYNIPIAASVHRQMTLQITTEKHIITLDLMMKMK